MRTPNSSTTAALYELAQISSEAGQPCADFATPAMTTTGTKKRTALF